MCNCVTYVFLDTGALCICETPSKPYRAGIHAYVDRPDGSWSCFWGVAGDRERVWPLFDVLADVKSGAWAGAGPIIQHHYGMLAIGCVLD